MNANTETQSKTVVDKLGNYTEEKVAHLGESLETANDKAADLKDKMESGYRRTVSPAIDSAQVDVASASRYMQESSMNDYLRDLKAFASRHPMINTAASLIIGWKIGRALMLNTHK